MPAPDPDSGADLYETTQAVLEGIRSAEEEGTIPHEEVMRHFKEKSAKFRRAARKRAE